MKRILFAVVAVGLLTAGALATYGLRQCWAAEATVASASAAEYVVPGDPGAAPFGTAVVAADEPFYQGELAPTSGQPQSVPSAASAPKGSARTIKVPVPVTVYEARTATVYQERVVSTGPMTPLQQQFCDLMLKKAQRMTDDELKSAIETVETELKEQDDAANAELQQAIEILSKLKQEAAGTPAANRASQALPILDGTQRLPTAPTPVPSSTVSPFQTPGEEFQQPSNPSVDY